MDMKETSQDQEVKLIYANNLNEAKNEIKQLTCFAEKAGKNPNEIFSMLISLASLYTAIGYKNCLRTLGIWCEED